MSETMRTRKTEEEIRIEKRDYLWDNHSLRQQHLDDQAFDIFVDDMLVGVVLGHSDEVDTLWDVHMFYEVEKMTEVTREESSQLIAMKVFCSSHIVQDLHAEIQRKKER